MPSSVPALTYGGAYFPTNEDDLKKLFELLKEKNIENIDTARVYPNSEDTLGKSGVVPDFKITSKVRVVGPHSLQKEKVFESAKESFEALKTDKIDIYLLHAPDRATPISETLGAIQELYKQGKFNQFGLSNFSVEEVQEVYDYAKSKGYILPTVYQSSYNLITRKNETLLFPTLRRLGISVQGYSPFAGGFLMKTPEFIKTVNDGGRWDPSTFNGKLYQAIYNRPPLLDYLEKFGQLAEKSGVGRVGIAYRWVRYHSALNEKDTVIVGATTLKQFEQALVEIAKGPLEGSLVEELDKMWKSIEKDVPADIFEVALGISAV